MPINKYSRRAPVWVFIWVFRLLGLSRIIQSQASFVNLRVMKSLRTSEMHANKLYTNTAFAGLNTNDFGVRMGARIMGRKSPRRHTIALTRWLSGTGRTQLCGGPAVGMMHACRTDEARLVCWDVSDYLCWLMVRRTIWPRGLYYTGAARSYAIVSESKDYCVTAGNITLITEVCACIGALEWGMNSE